MLLRIQHERQTQTHFPSLMEYSKMFGLREGGSQPDSGTIILHPGPINRGVEIDSTLADSSQSVILDQVTTVFLFVWQFFMHAAPLHIEMT